MTCNLLAVVLLLLADLAALIPPTTLRLPAFLAIGFEVLAYLNLFFALTWLFTHRKAWCLVSILALLLSTSQLRATFSMSSKIQESGSRSLRVLTYNTHLLQDHTPLDHNDLISYVRESGADIVCMQEYAVYRDAHYPTFQSVKNALIDIYPYTYFDFAIHNRRLQFGLAVYSKYPLTNKTTIPIHTAGNGANYCDVIVHNDTFRLFNNHLQSNALQTNALQPSEIDSLRSLLNTSSSKLTNAYVARTEQVKTIKPIIDASPYPVIVCGDFNDVPASYTYRHLSRGLKDAFLTTSLFRTGHTYVRASLIPWFRSSSFVPGVRIDYILTSPTFRVTDFRLDRVPYSDHYPVTASLTW